MERSVPIQTKTIGRLVRLEGIYESNSSASFQTPENHHEVIRVLALLSKKLGFRFISPLLQLVRNSGAPLFFLTVYGKFRIIYTLNERYSIEKEGKSHYYKVQGIIVKIDMNR